MKFPVSTEMQASRKKSRARKSGIPPRDTLSEEQCKEIEEAFDILDIDGSGNSCHHSNFLNQSSAEACYH